MSCFNDYHNGLPNTGAADVAREKQMSERRSGGDPRDDVVKMTLTSNVGACKLPVEPRMTLLDALREELVLTGAKKG